MPSLVPAEGDSALDKKRALDPWLAGLAEADS